MKALTLISLWARGFFGPSLIDETTDCAVALTSFGKRIRTVSFAIESIGRGTQRPARLILYLAESERSGPLPLGLRRQRTRGLEIAWVPDYRSYKKSYPYAATDTRPLRPLVTADDDVIYPRDWLQGLVNAGRQQPRVIHGYRGRRILLGDSAELAPYARWPLCFDTDPSPAVFLTGVSGIRYPVAFLEEVARAGDGFLEAAPSADDVWMHALAVKHGFLHRQIRPEPQEFETIPRTQQSALMQENVDAARNDDQIRACYSPTDLLRIQAAATSGQRLRGMP